jgi:hypothetical protein
MKSVPVTRLSNDDLLCELKQNVAHGCTHTARQVALIAEVDRRRLYAPAGFPSMFTFCVGELHLPEDAAYKRIQVARVARRHPAVLTALAEGRVHLTGLNLMSAHFKVLPPEVVNELLEAATHRSKKDIELLLAQRFPKADLQAEVRAIPSAGVQSPALKSEPANERPEQPQPVANTESELAPAQVGRPVIPAIRPAEYTRVAPLAPQRYGVQFTLDEVGHDLLRQVQDLLGHEVPRSDLAEVFVRALKAYATLLAKQKHAATEHPRVPRPQKPGSRHISGHVSGSFGSATRVSARTSTTPAIAARRARTSNTTTRSNSPAAARRPPRTSGSDAAPTTSTARSAPMGPRSCSTSARRGPTHAAHRSRQPDDRVVNRVDEDAADDTWNHATGRLTQGPWILRRRGRAPGSPLRTIARDAGPGRPLRSGSSFPGCISRARSSPARPYRRTHSREREEWDEPRRAFEGAP